MRRTANIGTLAQFLGEPPLPFGSPTPASPPPWAAVRYHVLLVQLAHERGVHSVQSYSLYMLEHRKFHSEGLVDVGDLICEANSALIRVVSDCSS